MTTEEYLFIVWSIAVRIRKVREQLIKLMNVATAIGGSQFSDMPKAPGFNSSKVESIACKIADLKTSIAAEEEVLLQLFRELSKCGCTERQYKVMWMRYAEALSWPEVANKVGVGRRTAIYEHDVAVSLLKKYFSES